MTIVEKPTLPKVFKSEVNKQLLAQAVRIYLGNQRTAAAHTKTRYFVNKTTKKMYKQKGTGNARHGSAAAPIFVGGGVAFGPTGEQNYTGHMPAKMRKVAVASALASRAADKKITVLTGADKATGKTSQAAKLIPARSLIIASPSEEKFVRACKNLKRTFLTYPSQLSAYPIISTKNLVITDTALAEVAKIYA